jgi:ParB-like chromosome segregation protein Spo0J
VEEKMSKDPKPITVPLMFLLTPKDYIWGKVDKRTVEKYATVASEAPEWPFPPILVRPVPAPATIAEDHPDKCYEIVDGMKRYAVAADLNLDGIPVVIEPLDDSAAALRQMTENLRHGQGLDLNTRDAWIKHLVSPRSKGGLGLSTRIVAAQAGISRETVRRISHDDRSGSKARKASKERKDRRWSPEAAFERFRGLAEECVRPPRRRSRRSRRCHDRPDGKCST